MKRQNPWLIALITCCSLLATGQLMAAKDSKLLGVGALMSPENIDKRTAPSARVCVEGDDSCGSAVVEAPVAAAAPKTPEELYNGACVACHAAGVLGAPKLGSKEDWEPRIAQGEETLYTHAINGFNNMPPKGTCASCSDDDIKAIVDYMISSAQ